MVDANAVYRGIAEEQVGLAIALNAEVLVGSSFVERKSAAVEANVARSVQRRKLTRISRRSSYGAVDVDASRTS